MKRQLAMALVIYLLSIGTANACGGGANSVNSAAKEIFSTENLYIVGTELAGFGNSVAGQAVGTFNGMMFTLVEFFSEEENLEDFKSARETIEHSYKTRDDETARLSDLSEVETRADFSLHEINRAFQDL